MAFRPQQGFPTLPRFGAPQQPTGFGFQFRPGIFRPPTNGAVSVPEPDLKISESGLLFVSNINEKCPNDLLKDVLDTFGKVEKWTRIGVDGNYPPFGFCGFEKESSAIMAILTLNNFSIGGKRLNVKADEKVKQKLVDFVINDRIAKRLSRKALGKELIPDESDREQILEHRKKLRAVLYNRDPHLVTEDDGDLDAKEEVAVKPAEEVVSKKRSSSHSKKKKHRSKRSRSRSPSSKKRSKKHSRSLSKSSSKKGSRSRSKSHTKSSKKRKRDTSSSRSSSPRSDRKRKSRDSSYDHYNGLDSDDSDVVMQRKERKRENHRKDEQYLRELKKFEERERRLAKQHAKEDENDQAKKKNMHKEAKKLSQFLEDYDDQRDDPKYYKNSMLGKRKRDYENERNADEKDRKEEAKELEAIKEMIAAENKKAENSLLKDKRTNGKVSLQTFQYSFIEDKSVSTDSKSKQPGSNEWTPVYGTPSTSSQQVSEPTKTQSNSKVITLQSKVLSQVNSVFAEEEPEEDPHHVIKKKIKPFEITAQDRIDSMTAEEKKKMVKELIEAIPTRKEDLFDYEVKWDYLDSELIEQRIKPWIEKKIRDYIGDDEPSLVSFICERVTSKTDPPRLLNDLQVILDDEAEPFVIKLWRLLIFQLEAKKSGLDVNSGKS